MIWLDWLDYKWVFLRFEVVVVFANFWALALTVTKLSTRIYTASTYRLVEFGFWFFQFQFTSTLIRIKSFINITLWFIRSHIIIHELNPRFIKFNEVFIFF